MKLPTQKRILREDVKGAPDWVNRIIDTFNSFAETVYQAFNKNITLSENVRCFTKVLTYKTTSSYPAHETVEFENELKVKASGVLVMQAYDRSSYVAAPGPVYAPWVEDNGMIRVGALTGLEANKTYVVSLLVV